MKKNIILLLGLVLCFSLSCTKEESLSSEKEIIEFSIGIFGPNAGGTVDQVAKTITFEVPSGTDVTFLTPMIKVSPLAKVTPAIGEPQDFTNPVSYTVTAEDGTKQVYVVKVVVLKSEERSMLSFKLAGLNPEVVGAIDEAKKTVKLSVPFGTNVTELVPTITSSKSATVTPATGVKQDFTKPVTYTVTAESGAKQEYVVTVEVAKNSERSITEFKLAGLNPEVLGTIDEAKKTIKLSVPFGTNIKELVPTVTTSKNATVTPATGVVQDFTKPVTYTVTSENGVKQAYVVTVEGLQNTEKKITEFKLVGLTPEVVGTIDEEKKTVTLLAPYGTNVKELTPALTLSTNATVAPATGLKQDFTQPVTYTVTAQNGTKQAYTVTVACRLNSENSITGFKLAGLSPEVVGVVSDADKTVTLSVPSTVDVTALVPTITLSKGATVLPASGSKQDFSKAVAYTVKAEDGTERSYTVSVNVVKSDAKKLHSFRLEGLTPQAEGVVDEANHTVTLSVPSNTNVTALVPTITLSDRATVTPALGAAQDFTQPVTYTITAENGTVQAYVVTVKVAKNSEKNITEFKFASLNPAVVATIDPVGKTITAKVPYGTDLRSLVPTVLVSGGATVLPLSGSATDFSSAVTYTVTAQDGTSIPYLVTITVDRNVEAKISTFAFDKLSPVVGGAIDESAKTIALTVPYGTNVTSLVPSISISERATILPASGAAVDFTNAVTYTVKSESGAEVAYSVKVDVAKSMEAKISAFAFDKLSPVVGGTIDESAKTILLTVPYGTNVASLIPAISVSERATISPASGVATNFTNEVAYKVTSEGGAEATYTVKVVVQKLVPVIASVNGTSIVKGNVIILKGTFAAEGNVVTLEGTNGSVVTLANLTESATLIEATVPATTPDGSYTLSVTAGGAKGVFSSSINISDGKPAISSIKESSLIVGIGEVVITGVNLKRDGTTSYISIGNTKFKGTVNEAGTEIRAKVPSNTPLGAAKVKVQVGVNNNSNELDITILENTLPVPVITAVSALELQAGDVLEITGTNFMKAGNSVRLATTGFPALNYVLDMVSENETSLRFSTAKVVKPGSFDLYVMANGKETKYTVKIKMTLKPAVITEVSPLKLKAGEIITVTGENFNKETLSMILINDGAHKITYVDSKHATIVASTDLAPGKYVLDIKIGATTATGGPTFKTIYSTDIEIIK